MLQYCDLSEVIRTSVEMKSNRSCNHRVNTPSIQKTRSSADADNRLDAFSGQSRSTNMVPFHMLHIVSYCAIVTLSLRHILPYSSSKNFMTLKWGSKVTQGH